MTVAERNRIVEGNMDIVEVVVNTVCPVVPDGLDHDDLVSVGMLALTEAASGHEGRNEATFKTFAWGVIKNAVIDELRSADACNTAIPTGPMEAWMHQIPDPSPGPHELYCAKEEAGILEEARDTLAPERQEILDQRYDHEMTFEEIGALLGGNPGGSGRGAACKRDQEAVSALRAAVNLRHPGYADARAAPRGDAHATAPAA